MQGAGEGTAGRGGWATSLGTQAYAAPGPRRVKCNLMQAARGTHTGLRPERSLQNHAFGNRQDTAHQAKIRLLTKAAVALAS
jgi:hypothetical protein